MKTGLDVSVTIAIDVMGGDFGPSVTVEAALLFLERHEAAKVILVGQPDPIGAELSRLNDLLTVSAPPPR